MLMDLIARLYAPYNCVGCLKESPILLCGSCEAAEPRLPPRCYLCKQTSRNWQTCENCRKKSTISELVAYADYGGNTKELIHSFKYERAVGAAGQLGEWLAAEINELDCKNALLVPVPTATSRVRQRGYDHAEMLAMEASKRSNINYANLLARLGQAHQVGAKRGERNRQMSGAFRAIHPERIKGKHVVLVDDIVTTGATLREAARVLKKAGARKISAVVIAQP